MKTRFGFAFVLGILLALTLGGLARAQSANPTPVITDDQVNAVAKQLYCPVCENTPLDVCPTQACAQWRELIRQKLGEGWSEQQIKDYFAQQYGIRVLGTPPAQGLVSVLYVLPYVAIVAGVYVLYRVLKTLRRTSSAPASQNQEMPAPSGSPAETDQYIQKLEEELRKR